MRRLKFPSPLKRNPVTLDAALPDQDNAVDRDKQPTNAELILAANQFQKDLPDMLDRTIRSTRDFFLSTVAPRVISVKNGMQDALDVIRLVAEEEPQATEYVNLMNSLTRDAMFLKVARHVALVSNLGPVEFSLLLKSSLRLDVAPADVAAMLQEDRDREDKLTQQDKRSRKKRAGATVDAVSTKLLDISNEQRSTPPTTALLPMAPKGRPKRRTKVDTTSNELPKRLDNATTPSSSSSKKKAKAGSNGGLSSKKKAKK